MSDIARSRNGADLPMVKRAALVLRATPAYVESASSCGEGPKTDQALGPSGCSDRRSKPHRSKCGGREQGGVGRFSGASPDAGCGTAVLNRGRSAHQVG